MNKTIILILCFSFISLAIGMFIGYRINPIKDETIEELDYVTNSLEGINAINDLDIGLLKTKSFVSILIGVLEHLKNDDKESAISVASDSLRDIHTELTKGLDADSLSDDEKQLIELIEPNLVNDQQAKEKSQ